MFLITFQSIFRPYFLSSLSNVKLLNLFLHHFSSTCNWLHVWSTRYPRHSGAAKTFDRFPTCQVHQRDQMLEDRNHSLRNNATKIQVYIIEIEYLTGTSLRIWECGCQIPWLLPLNAYFIIYFWDFTKIHKILPKKCGCQLACFQKVWVPWHPWHPRHDGLDVVDDESWLWSK